MNLFAQSKNHKCLDENFLKIFSHRDITNYHWYEYYSEHVLAKLIRAHVYFKETLKQPVITCRHMKIIF